MKTLRLRNGFDQLKRESLNAYSRLIERGYTPEQGISIMNCLIDELQPEIDHGNFLAAMAMIKIITSDDDIDDQIKNILSGRS